MNASTAQVRIERKYHSQSGAVRSASVLVFDDTDALLVDVNVTTGVVGYASDWGVDGDVLRYGTNYGPATYGHTDVVLAPELLAAVVSAL